MPPDELSAGDQEMLRVNPDDVTPVVPSETPEPQSNPEQEQSENQLRAGLRQVAENAHRVLREFRQRTEERFTNLLYEDDQAGLDYWIKEIVRVCDLPQFDETEMQRAMLGLGSSLEKIGEPRRSGGVRDDVESLHHLRRALQELGSSIEQVQQTASRSEKSYPEFISTTSTALQTIEQRWFLIGRLANAFEGYSS